MSKIPKMHWKDAVDWVRFALDESFLDSDRAARRPRTAPKSWGLCYVACEAVMHLSDERLHPVNTKVHGESHWFLRDEAGNIIDPTVDQFQGYIPVEEYQEGTGRGFLTKGPSRRTCRLLDKCIFFMGGARRSL
jgi:hypothetical protein